ncbi:hypothetical protein HMPREF1095_05091 [Enterocloster bolteae 90A5]|nr:hypothetical protein HMPREF1095_05091 [Enterocloster bolteae 90A5]ENZ72016.1 hypothetical protein HMPREF1096_01485 [Enterocloster bolteae 90B7]KMW16386.1 hypothetical protein HMPREF9472_03267 [Enterocloster bolteae WAL-14578]
MGNRLISPISARMPAENTGPIHLMDVKVLVISSICSAIALSKTLICCSIARIELIYRKHLVYGVVYHFLQSVGTPGGFLGGFRYCIRIRETIFHFLDNKSGKLL